MGLWRPTSAVAAKLTCSLNRPPSIHLLPVADHRSISRGIERSKTELHTPFFDAQALVTQAVKVPAEPNSFARLSVSARELVANRFDLRKHRLPQQLAMVLGEAS